MESIPGARGHDPAPPRGGTRGGASSVVSAVASDGEARRVLADRLAAASRPAAAPGGGGAPEPVVSLEAQVVRLGRPPVAGLPYRLLLAVTGLAIPLEVLSDGPLPVGMADGEGQP